MEKITILGDIMVEPPFMEQVAKQGSYDFKPSFAPLKAILRDSDYIIGNLETPLAGPESGYTHELVSFNSPDVLVEVLQEIGIDAVSTAESIGIQKEHAANYCVAEDTEAVYQEVCESISSFRECGTLTSDWGAKLEKRLKRRK